jgi:hypothetical protein
MLFPPFPVLFQVTVPGLSALMSYAFPVFPVYILGRVCENNVLGEVWGATGNTGNWEHTTIRDEELPHAGPRAGIERFSSMNPVQSGRSDSNDVSPSRGSLRNGNRPGDPSKSPRCGARTRAGKPCRAPAMWSAAARAYTRCWLHGGASTGPRTPEGLARSKKAHWLHGGFSQEQKQRCREVRAMVRRQNAEERLFERFAPRILRALYRARKAGGIPGPEFSLDNLGPKF